MTSLQQPQMVAWPGSESARPDPRAAAHVPVGSPAREPIVLLAVLLTALILSGIAPAHRLTWLLEEAPLFLGVPVLIATFHRFRLHPVDVPTALRLRSAARHRRPLHVFGGSRRILGRDTLGLARNNFDRLVHFVGGLAPAIGARELLLRKTRLRPGGWLVVIVSLVCLGGSAIYEILEWWAARLAGFEAGAFLAAQGDVWDAQWDMFVGLLGALTGQFLFRRRHDRELAKMASPLAPCRPSRWRNGTGQKIEQPRAEEERHEP